MAEKELEEKSFDEAEDMIVKKMKAAKDAKEEKEKLLGQPKEEKEAKLVEGKEAKEKLLSSQSSSEKLITHEDLKLLVEAHDEKIARLQAEFENYKKRNENEKKAHSENASAKVIADLLPVLDDFDAAVMHGKDAKEGEGIKMLREKLFAVLKKEGLAEMEAKEGDWFDPYYHEAAAKEKGKHEEGKIEKVIKKGYKFKGKVLRHAKVVVSAGNA